MVGVIRYLIMFLIFITSGGSRMPGPASLLTPVPGRNDVSMMALGCLGTMIEIKFFWKRDDRLPIVNVYHFSSNLTTWDFFSGNKSSTLNSYSSKSVKLIFMDMHLAIFFKNMQENSNQTTQSLPRLRLNTNKYTVLCYYAIWY